MKNGYITGLHTDNGNIEPRLEIDEFVLDRDVLNVFLLALINLQGRDYDDPWSWFQIAGKQPGSDGHKWIQDASSLIGSSFQGSTGNLSLTGMTSAQNQSRRMQIDQTPVIAHIQASPFQPGIDRTLP